MARSAQDAPSPASRATTVQQVVSMQNPNTSAGETLAPATACCTAAPRACSLSQRQSGGGGQSCCCGGLCGNALCLLLFRAPATSQRAPARPSLAVDRRWRTVPQRRKAPSLQQNRHSATTLRCFAGHHRLGMWDPPVWASKMPALRLSVPPSTPTTYFSIAAVRYLGLKSPESNVKINQEDSRDDWRELCLGDPCPLLTFRPQRQP